MVSSRASKNSTTYSFGFFFSQLLDGDAMRGHHDRALGARGVGARRPRCARQRFQHGAAVAARRESRQGNL